MQAEKKFCLFVSFVIIVQIKNNTVVSLGMLHVCHVCMRYNLIGISALSYVTFLVVAILNSVTVGNQTIVRKFFFHKVKFFFQNIQVESKYYLQDITLSFFLLFSFQQYRNHPNGTDPFGHILRAQLILVDSSDARDQWSPKLQCTLFNERFRTSSNDPLSPFNCITPEMIQVKGSGFFARPSQVVAAEITNGRHWMAVAIPDTDGHAEWRFARITAVQVYFYYQVCFYFNFKSIFSFV